jgi:soluble lytic murein transglycosylase
MGAGSAILPQPIALSDADRYRQIFDLQRAGRYREAEAIIGWLSDHRLLGHVLAQRYLASDYKASYGELARWLSTYADHPEALRIYALAVSRRPPGDAMPRKPAVDSFHSGTTDDSALAGDPRWRWALALWRRHDLSRAATVFEALAGADQASPWDKAAAAYWASRAHLKNREPAKVSTWLRVASQYPRTFYGQLAIHALGLDPSFDWSLRPLTSAGIRAVAASSVGQRALALLQLGETGMAEDEMRGLLRQANPDLAAGLRGIAQLYQLPSVALGLGALADQQPNTRADAELYPLPHWRPNGGFTLNRALLLALVRQESGFDARAQSGAGAVGLMQIMPDTARALGARVSKLRDPAANLAVGQLYLRQLLADPSVKGDLFLMAIAYNAGPGSLLKWRASDPTADPLLFLESLPNRETRNFVERVMANYWVYQDRLGQDTPSLDRVAAGSWPAYEPQEPVAAASNGLPSGRTN